MGVVTLREHLYTPMFGHPPTFGHPPHICMPHATPYICMFLGVSAHDVGMGGIYTPNTECLDDDMLQLIIYT